MMAYRLAAEIPDQVAAIAAIAGTLDVDPSTLQAPVPILHFHGTADDHAPYDGGRGAKTFGDNRHQAVADTIAAWVRVNDADPKPHEEFLPDCREDGTRVIKYAHATPADPERVVLYKILNGGHTWPGRADMAPRLGRVCLDISANDLMWSFFEAHPRTTASGDNKNRQPRARTAAVERGTGWLTAATGGRGYNTDQPVYTALRRAAALSVRSQVKLSRLVVRPKWP
jgi:poly(3-hydroxybutyrate) depolymerase